MRTRIALLSCFALLLGCSRSEQSTPNSAETHEKEQHEASAAPSAGTVEVKSEVQQALRLEVTTLNPVSAPPELTAVGRVLAPETLAVLVSERDTARAAAAASEAEFMRLKTMEEQKSASLRALQAAEAAAVRDRLLVQSLHDRVELSWGRAIVSRTDLPALVQDLVTQERLIIRIDLPAGEVAPIELARARLSPLADPGKVMEATYLSSAPTTDPDLQGRGFLFLTADNPFNLTAGAAVSADLERTGQVRQGIFLPASAVIRYEGDTWVYLQRDPTHFARTEISLGRALPSGWLVVDKLHAGDRVVTDGAQLLLSEELKPETHLAN